MTRKHEGPQRRSGTQRTSNPARRGEFPEVKEFSKAVEAALTHQTINSSISEFAGSVVHTASGHGSPGNETTTRGRKKNWFKRWNKEHSAAWGAWLTAFVIALTPIFVSTQAGAQSVPQPQTTQAQISVASTGPPGPMPASGSGPMPGSGSTAEFVEVNLDLSVLANSIPSQPHTLSQKQIRIIADEIATEIHGQLMQKLPDESVPVRIKVGEFVYDLPPLGNSQSTSEYLSQHFSGNLGDASN